MEQTMIGVKHLQTKFAAVARAAQRGQSFLVMKHTTPLFRIEPVEKRQEPRYTIDDLKAIRFTSRDRNLSKKIDAYLYNV
jgi:antitoxin (DNA-binding transcriptional repressor) of toxin-antitoxin stability system